MTRALSHLRKQHTHITPTRISKRFSSWKASNKWVQIRPFRCKCGASSFSRGNNYWTYTFFFLLIPSQCGAAGWLNYACLFVAFITEADVSVRIMEGLGMLLCCVSVSLSLLSGWRDDERFGPLASLNGIVRLLPLVLSSSFTKLPGSSDGVRNGSAGLISASMPSAPLCRFFHKLSAMRLFNADVNLRSVLLIS